MQRAGRRANKKCRDAARIPEQAEVRQPLSPPTALLDSVGSDRHKRKLCIDSRWKKNAQQDHLPGGFCNFEKF